MRRVLTLTAVGILGVAMAACSNAEAAISQSEALRCTAAMGVGAKLAQDAGDALEMRQFSLRTIWFAEKAGLLPATSKSDALIGEAIEAFVAPGVDMVGIADRCIKKSNADPDFKDSSRARFDRREFPFN